MSLKEEQRPGNSTYKKLAVQWLNEHLCFVSSSVLADNFVLRNRQLFVAAKRYHQAHANGNDLEEKQKIKPFIYYLPTN